MKILLIQQKMIGDVLTSSILAEAIKTKYPHSQVDYLINSSTFSIVENNPWVDNFIFVTPEIEKNYLKFFQFLQEIKKKKYSHIIDIYGKLSSNLISYFSKANIKISYYKKEKTFLYSNNIKRIKIPQHQASLAIENRMRLLEPLGIEFIDITPKIYLLQTEIEDALNFLKKSGVDLQNPIYMLSVLGSNYKKSYPSEYMAQLINFVIEKKPNAQLLFNYIPNQKEEAKEILNLTKPRTKKNIFFEVYARNLRELLAITHRCSAVIGNEGGLINMAKALNVPTFIIFSPYLKKENWFGSKEVNLHSAVQLSDYISYGENDWIEAKKHPEVWYSKFEPHFIEPLLEIFLKENNGL